jgi:hypothetical protein
MALQKPFGNQLQRFACYSYRENDALPTDGKRGQSALSVDLGGARGRDVGQVKVGQTGHGK